MTVELTAEEYQFCKKHFNGRAFFRTEGGRFWIKSNNVTVLKWLEHKWKEK